MKFYFEELKIVNIVKPKLIIKCWDISNDSRIEISYKKAKICLERNTEQNRKYNYEIKIPFFSKITINLINEENYELILKFNFFNKIFRFMNAFFLNFIKGIKILIKNPHIIFSRKLLKKYLIIFKTKCGNDNIIETLNPFDQKEYQNWIFKTEIFNQTEIKKLKYNPLFSFIIPVYNPKLTELKECIESINNQTYNNFEICICDDCSNMQTNEYLKSLEVNLKYKIKYNSENCNISVSTNEAVKMAHGEFLVFIDQDDTIDKDALYECAKILNQDNNIDFLYSDYDKLDENGLRCEPYFKPDFSLDTLFSHNYLTHLTIIRKSLIEKIGGFRKEYDGAQDYDLFLRLIEIKNIKIYHISKILYHWRKSSNSTSKKIQNKNYAFLNGKKALEDYFIRNNQIVEVKTKLKSSFYCVEYPLKNKPIISIVIPTKDHVELLKNCVNSILEKTNYDNYEILIVNNNSIEKETLDYFKTLKDVKNIKVIEYNQKFNYSKINNFAISKSKGEYVVLLNNDTQIITPKWLDLMLGYASQEHVGVVGPKLLYEDNTIQHAGVIIGLGGVASHAYIGFERKSQGIYANLECPTNYSAVTAACLMVKKAKYLQVNGLEEKLEVAYNDIDFCLKLLNKGYYNLFVPQVELYHYESKSRGLDNTGEKYERFLKESKLMFDKWQIGSKKDRFYNKNYSLKSAFRLDK